MGMIILIFFLLFSSPLNNHPLIIVQCSSTGALQLGTRFPYIQLIHYTVNFISMFYEQKNGNEKTFLFQ